MVITRDWWVRRPGNKGFAWSPIRACSVAPIFHWLWWFWRLGSGEDQRQ